VTRQSRDFALSATDPLFNKTYENNNNFIYFAKSYDSNIQELEQKRTNKKKCTVKRNRSDIYIGKLEFNLMDYELYSLVFFSLIIITISIVVIMIIIIQ